MNAIPQVAVVIVTCPCGNYPLDAAMHASSRLAWQAAADHVALNPGKCHPTMYRDYVPAALAGLAPAADPVPPPTAAFVAI